MFSIEFTIRSRKSIRVAGGFSASDLAGNVVVSDDGSSSSRTPYRKVISNSGFESSLVPADGSSFTFCDAAVSAIWLSMLINGFTPIPLATNTARFNFCFCVPSSSTLESSTYCGGGHTKLPPTRILSSVFRISRSGLKRKAAVWLSGEDLIASSRYRSPPDVDGVMARDGADVIVNPPALEIPGTWTSSHWPGLNCTCELDVRKRSGIHWKRKEIGIGQTRGDRYESLNVYDEDERRGKKG